MKVFKLGLAVGVMLAFVACTSDTNPFSAGTGGIMPKLKVNPEVKTVSPITQSRAGDSTPTADDLSITLTSEDGSISQKWQSLSSFPTDEAFKVGRYTMTAYYGDINVEGFEKPYFYGESSFDVHEDQVTDVNIEAKLANTMISITYTDAFRNYFVNYGVELHSEGGRYLSYDREETRPIYMHPGDISMNVLLTKQNGVSATFQPATLTNALPQHHYRITLDVNEGEMGAAKLIISFDDSVVEEDVTIDLSDEIMNSPAPEVTPEGFEQGTAISLFEGESPANPVKMKIIARGGLSAATLTTNCSSLQDMGWPAEIELMTALESQRARLRDLGLKVTGLYNNPDKMAIIDFTAALAKIKYVASAPESTFTLVVKDKAMKVNDPVVLSVNTTPVEVGIVSISDATVSVNEAEMIISYNGNDFDNNITIQTKDAYGVWGDARILSVNGVSRASSNYTVKFVVPDGVNDIPVRVNYCGVTKAEGTIHRISPQFSILVDTYSNKAIIKIVPENSEMLSTIVKNAAIYINNSKVSIASRSESTGLLTVTGLTPATEYSFKATVMEGSSNPTFTEIVTATTETQAAVPNGGFEESQQTINTTINCGGIYYETKLNLNPHQNTKAFNVSVPTQWANVNAKTFCTSASNKNTWYMQPSTMIDTSTKQEGTNSVKLISVAWDNNGPEIEKYNFTWGQLEENYGYSHNAPSRISYRAAGKLFLGSYTFTSSSTSEAYNEGISFASRPSALNGYYRYTPGTGAASDRGLVKVEVVGVENGSEVTIASGSLMLAGTSGFSSFSVPLSYSKFGVKASKLKVMFASSNKIGTISYETSNIVTTNDLESASSLGSTLWIDNLTFSY
ncbi:MAG: DUF4493 domain-containing protein [Muribaculaceae bacterium]|nr:DUF4493 domain-containing protein [Muribaculaceae bacterium]MBR5435426.1 DUF4493 domain-containing protein [Muribaculaceae bacterium]